MKVNLNIIVMAKEKKTHKHLLILIVTLLFTLLVIYFIGLKIPCQMTALKNVPSV